MSAGTRSISQIFHWRVLIAGNGEWCRYRQPKTPSEKPPQSRLASTLLMQGKRKYPLPLHPIPSPGCKERKKCQGCPRPFSSNWYTATDRNEKIGTKRDVRRRV